MKYFLAICCFLLVNSFDSLLFSQNINEEIQLNQVDVEAKRKSGFKSTGLYDEQEEIEVKNIDGFYAVDLYHETITNEIWFTENKKCVSVLNESSTAYRGKNCLHIKWDKISGGCNWIGMGIGWNGWQGKDMGTIMNKTAIEFYARTTGDTLKGLPLALALEDYSGVQSYIGFSPAYIVGKKITANWTKIIVPLNAFPYRQNDLDISNIKQFIIQFEADGELFIDEITLVPFEGILKPAVQLTKNQNDIMVDGVINSTEWKGDTISLENNTNFFIQFDDQYLYLGGMVNDDSPLINTKDNNEIWNGDAIELAFGSNPEADMNRTRYLFSDFQLGIKLGTEQYVWNWKMKNRVEGAEVKTQLNADGYVIEAKIPLSTFGKFTFIEGKNYGFEIALDNGNASGKRITQTRWASSHAEGFHLNPSLWGIVKVKGNSKQ
jgi:Carbohydrate family 9 binding domain-like